MTNECSVCQKKFSKHSNLRCHVKKFHPDLLNEVAPNKVFKCSAVCNKCNKTFTMKSNLKQHVLKFHAEEENKLTSSKVYPCEICQKNFSGLNHYIQHKKTHQGEESVDKLVHSFQCSLCNIVCATKLSLINHFEQDHGIKISVTALEFSNESDFKNWKSNLEEKSYSQYVKQRGSYKTSEGTKTVYVCKRSGFYVPKGSGKRHLKTQGTSKINGMCPSEMQVTVLENDEHKITFTETHIGHDQDLGHLHLTVEQRMDVAKKIATNVPFSCILDGIRDSISNDKLERIHLLTTKDMHNITQTFNLCNDSVRHKDDVISLESWIGEVHESGTVVYYKPQGRSCSRHSYLKEVDFMLIIMHPGQLEIQQRFKQKKLF
ncbi:zinc finger protein 436-like [Dendroctonus ponderosae]|uniref:zinc finger protein 436-like n=1 Tax=Dendroctonus ponderosae TaxID=77166 RepID=UPI0020364F3C|nr:zinc finger protein 436-like [Dendroctonus ponderosae]